MPRVIFKCPHVKGGTAKAAAHLGNAVGYIATRKGVQRIDPGKIDLLATENQINMVEKLAREFPLSKGLEEYVDYQESPTRGNASEFITRAIEDNLDQIAKMENYVDYIAKRPRAQRFGSHGLFTSGSDSLTLSKIQEEVAHHPGTVWLPIISLRREDATRLGFDSAEKWKDFLSGYSIEMAQAMKIPLEQFRWYAAFHDESHHPHVHMVCYSTDGKSGYLTQHGIERIKSGLAKEIFKNDLTEIYARQTQRRDSLNQDTQKVLRQLIQQMQDGTLSNERIEQLMLELAKQLPDLTEKRIAALAVGCAPMDTPDLGESMDKLFGPLPQLRGFYCQGGLDYARMGAVDRAMMAALRAALKAKPDQAEMLAGIAKSFDGTRREYLEPVIRWAGQAQAAE